MSWNTSFAGQNPCFFCLNISTYLKYHANSYGFNSNLSTCYRHLQLCIPSMLHAAFLLYFKGNYWGRDGIATSLSCTAIFAFLTPSSFSVCFLVEGWIYWFWGQCNTRESKRKLALVCNKLSRASR